MSTTSSQLSASVTRILALSNFPKELKTRDLIAAFSEWETEPGGFKVKWVDDTNALIVFGEASVAKKAYLQTLLRPHLSLTAGVIIKPYDGPDAQSIIASVNARGAQAAGASRHGQGAGSISGINAFNGNAASSFGNGPPISGSHHRQSSSHTRMGSFGSSAKPWGSSVSPPVSFSRATGNRRLSSPSSQGESDSPIVGGADAALGEIEKALKGVTTRGAQILGPGHMVGGHGQVV